MRHELFKHLTPLAAIFAIASIFWAFSGTAWYHFFYLFLGLILGAFFLDTDHLIYWYYIEPDLQESKLARVAIANKDYKSVLKILEATHKSHTNLIFHHYLFQIILAIVSIFAFTSSSNTFGQAFLVSLNIHLLADEYEDYKNNPQHLQNWLFARSLKQLPINYLPKLLTGFAIATVFFILLLIKSKT